MRVTNNMIMSNNLYNLNRNLERLNRINSQLSTQTRINRPSDDPADFAKAMRLSTDLAEIEQYKKNTDAGLSWLNITESAVSNVVDIMHKAKELAVEGATETYDGEDRKKMAEQVRQLREHLVQLGNTTYAGRYIFSGFKTDQKLFDDVGNYNIDTTNVQTIKYQIGVGEKIDIGIYGTELFGGGGAIGTSSEMIQDFDDFITALEGDNTGNIASAISDIDKHLNKALTVMSEIGAKVNRLELVQNRFDKNNMNYTELLNKTAGVDMAEATMNLKMEEYVYRSSLAAGARVIQPTLIDFIK